MYLHYELTELEFREFMKYYDKRETTMSPKPEQEEPKPKVPDPGQDDDLRMIYQTRKWLTTNDKYVRIIVWQNHIE